MLDEPPATSSSPKRLADSLKSRLKELQLFRGPGTLVLLTWEDLAADVQLATLQGDRVVSLGEATHAAEAGLSAVLLSTAELGKGALKAYLRSPAGKAPIRLKRQDITWDGKDFQVEVGEVELPAGASQVGL
jgi:hypothetical protein